MKCCCHHSGKSIPSCLSTLATLRDWHVRYAEIEMILNLNVSYLSFVFKYVLRQPFRKSLCRKTNVFIFMYT